MRLRSRDALDDILEGGAAGKHVADAECRRNAEVARKADAVKAPVEQNRLVTRDAPAPAPARWPVRRHRSSRPRPPPACESRAGPAPWRPAVGRASGNRARRGVAPPLQEAAAACRAPWAIGGRTMAPSWRAIVKSSRVTTERHAQQQRRHPRQQRQQPRTRPGLLAGRPRPRDDLHFDRHGLGIAGRARRLRAEPAAVPAPPASTWRGFPAPAA